MWLSFLLAAVATKAVHKRGPGPSKPPPVTLGVSGKGFGEKVPSSAKLVKNGIKTIGVLSVDKDFGDFVEVDKAYWNKEVASFVGERVCRLFSCYPFPDILLRSIPRAVITASAWVLNAANSWPTPLFACAVTTPSCCAGLTVSPPWILSTTIVLTHIVRSSSWNHRFLTWVYVSDTLNAFLAALDTLGQHVDSIEDILLNYLSGINVLSHVAGLRLQTSHIRECAVADGIVDEADGDEDNDEDDEVPEDVAEGVAGPSKKRKHK